MEFQPDTNTKQFFAASAETNRQRKIRVEVEIQRFPFILSEGDLILQYYDCSSVVGWYITRNPFFICSFASFRFV